MSYPSIDIKKLHPYRYCRERTSLIPLLDEFRKSFGNQEKYTEAENNAIDFFAKHIDETTAVELYNREDHFKRLIDFFIRDGQAIFSFEPHLIQMFCHSDVDAIPASHIIIPYNTIYCTFAPGSMLPFYSDSHYIDGAYIYWDSWMPNILSQFKTPDAVKKEYTEFYYRFGLKEWNNIFKGESVNDVITRYTELEVKKKSFWEAYKAEPDKFDYNDKDFLKINSTGFGMISAEFTFVPRTHSPIPLSAQSIAKEPSLRMSLSFDTHNQKIHEAIQENFNHGIRLDIYADTTDIWQDNSYTNIASDPRYIKETTGLVFNILSYLSWKDRDVIERLSDTKTQSDLDKAKTKKQKTSIKNHALKRGVRRINFCGYQTNYSENKSIGLSVASHWRRGHWRNQPFGTNRLEKRLIWIKPTLVHAEKETNSQSPTLYNV